MQQHMKVIIKTCTADVQVERKQTIYDVCFVFKQQQLQSFVLLSNRNKSKAIHVSVRKQQPSNNNYSGSPPPHT